ncbi:MAG: hypothetical protein HC876_09655 [Chloroflexaceae bacterium]|nr:hypothetical protein [Chloroflexaceae bacterium]NJO05754.1 hypothetical protein [Chloroflexaceae bacterium]
MTIAFDELIAAALQLTPAERHRMIDVLRQSLADAPPHPRGVPVEQIIGIAIPKDGHIPTDEEVEEEYINYLIEKYR